MQGGTRVFGRTGAFSDAWKAIFCDDVVLEKLFLWLDVVLGGTYFPFYAPKVLRNRVFFDFYRARGCCRRGEEFFAAF